MSMYNYINEGKDRHVGFYEAVAENAIKLGDDSEAPFISTDCGNVDKDSLTRYVARTLVKCIHDGQGNINDVCMECSIALMLFIKDGLQEEDFERAFQKELIDALQIVIKGKEALEVEKVLFTKKLDIQKKMTKSLDLFEKVYEDIDYYDDFFMFADSEIKQVLLEIKKTKYSKEDIEQAIGQYILIDDALGSGVMSRDMVLETTYRNLGFTSVNNCTYFAASTLGNLFFADHFMIERIIKYISKGIAIYRKNGLSDSDFWKNVCKDFYKILTSDHFFLNW